MWRPRRLGLPLALMGLGFLVVLLGVLLRRRSPAPGTQFPPQALVVAFLNVGQGEAAWVKTPEGRFLVIGAGPPEAGDHLVASLRAAGAKQIDLLVLPYPYSEALGGATQLLAQFPVKAALDTGWERVNQKQVAVLQDLENRRIPVKRARAGQGFDLGNGGQLEVLFPHEPRVGKSPAAANNSIVLRLRWGQTAFLWEGGLEVPGEEALLSLGHELQADVLRTARFANPGSASAELLRDVAPSYIVVSVGENRSGLPDESVLKRLMATGAQVLRTDQEKRDLLFLSDGAQVTLRR